MTTNKIATKQDMVNNILNAVRDFEGVVPLKLQLANQLDLVAENLDARWKRKLQLEARHIRRYAEQDREDAEGIREYCDLLASGKSFYLE